MKNKTQQEKTHIKVFGKEFAYIFIIIIIGSFIGFAAENTGRLITKGILDSRYHYLPFIFGYGIAVFAMYLALGTPDDMHFFGKKLFKEKSRKNSMLSNIIYLLVIYFFVFFGEIAVGVFYEKTTGLSLWDYSTMPLHVTKYASVITMILYGTGAYAIMKFAFGPLYRLLQRKMPINIANIINFSLGTLIIIDCIYMICYTLITHELPIRWSIQF